MSHPKENLKERLVVSAWAICEAGSWQKSNMRSVAQKAPISTAAFYRHFYRHFYSHFYRHFTNKNNFKAAVIRRDFQLIYEDMKDSNNDGNFAAYGAHYLRFGLEYPHIYDLMFENTHIDVSLYPHLEPQSNTSFNGLVKGVGSGSGCREWVPGVGAGSGISIDGRSKGINSRLHQGLHQGLLQSGEATSKRRQITPKQGRGYLLEIL